MLSNGIITLILPGSCIAMATTRAYKLINLKRLWECGYHNTNKPILIRKKKSAEAHIKVKMHHFQQYFVKLHIISFTSCIIMTTIFQIHLLLHDITTYEKGILVLYNLFQHTASYMVQYMLIHYIKFKCRR